MVDKAFCESTDDSSGRSLTCSKGKSISRIYVYASEDKEQSLPRWKWPHIINLPPGYRLITLGNGGIWGYSVDLCCWHVGHSEVAVVRSDLVSWSPYCWAHACPPSLPPLPLCEWPIGLWWGNWRKRLATIHRMGHLTYLNIKVVFCWCHLLVSIYMGNKYFYFCYPLWQRHHLFYSLCCWHLRVYLGKLILC